MSTITYKDPITELLIKRFEELGPKELKGRYYYGTAMFMSQNQLNFPACMISGGVDSITETETNTSDQSAILYRATVMVDMKEQWLTGKNRVGQEQLVHKLLMGRDENLDILGTIEGKEGSLEFAIRKNNVLDGEKRVYIDLGRGTRAYVRPNIEGRGRNMFLYEGILEFTVVKNQLKP